MNTISLTEEEISNIKSFINEITSIPMVECVYLVPYYIKTNNKQYLELYAVKNNSMLYNEQLTSKPQSRDVTEEELLFESIIEKYNNIFEGDRLCFTKTDDYYYSIQLLQTACIIAEKSLISGTILFDRFNNFTKNKEKVSEYISKYPNILEIDNINKINDDLKLVRN